MKHISGAINRVPDSPQPTLQPAGWKHSSIWGELVAAPSEIQGPLHAPNAELGHFSAIWFLQ